MTSNRAVRRPRWSIMGLVLCECWRAGRVRRSRLRAGEPFDVMVDRAAVIDGAPAGEADEIADAARSGDETAEFAISNRLALNGADRLLDPFGRELVRRAADLV